MSTPKTSTRPSPVEINLGDWKFVPVEPTYQMCEAMNIGWETGAGFPQRYKAMLSVAPAPDVDPAAYMRHRLVSGAGGLGGGVAVEFSEHPFGGFDDPASQDIDATVQPLYIHPAPSEELVKAAEDALKLFDRFGWVAGSTSYHIVKNLRAALSKHQPAKPEPKAPPTQDEMYAMELAMNRHLNGGGYE